MVFVASKTGQERRMGSGECRRMGSAGECREWGHAENGVTH